jgi:hypothetical protein
VTVEIGTFHRFLHSLAWLQRRLHHDFKPVWIQPSPAESTPGKTCHSRLGSNRVPRGDPIAKMQVHELYGYKSVRLQVMDSHRGSES